jgi:hypothetical protein
MVGVIQADADALAGSADARAEPGITRNHRQRFGIERRDAGQPVGQKNLAGDIPDMGGQIADVAVAIEKPRLFLAPRAVTQQFHGVSIGLV